MYIIIHDKKAKRYYSAKQLLNSAEVLSCVNDGKDWDDRTCISHNDEDCLCILQDVALTIPDDVLPHDIKAALEWAKSRGIMKKAIIQKKDIKDHYKIIEV